MRKHVKACQNSRGKLKEKIKKVGSFLRFQDTGKSSNKNPEGCSSGSGELCGHTHIWFSWKRGRGSAVLNLTATCCFDFCSILFPGRFFGTSAMMRQQRVSMTVAARSSPFFGFFQNPHQLKAPTGEPHLKIFHFESNELIYSKIGTSST